MQAANPEIVFVASYPPDSVGIVRAANEVGLKTRYFGGGMVGLQILSIKQQLGPMLNGILDYDWWLPIAKMQFPGIMEFLKKYQAKAPAEGVDPLGWYLPPFAYANLQVLQQAIESTQGARPGASSPTGSAATPSPPSSATSATARTANGPSRGSSRCSSRTSPGSGIDQFKTTKTEIVVAPPDFKTGEVLAPYSEVRK